MRKIAIMLEKGGVSKTTTAVNLSVALGKMGRKVLLIDLDPQGDATTHLGFDPLQLEKTLCQVLLGQIQAMDAIIQVEGIDLLPNQKDTSEAMEVPRVHARLVTSQMFKTLFEGVTGYDYVILDCPPSKNYLSMNAMAFADEMIIPVQPGKFEDNAVKNVLDTLDLLKLDGLIQALPISAIIMTRFGNEVVSENSLARYRQQYGGVVLETTVPRNVALIEAAEFGQSAINYSPTCPGSLAYNKIAKEIDGRRQ